MTRIQVEGLVMGALVCVGTVAQFVHNIAVGIW